MTTHGHILLREELKALENIGVYDNMRVESLLLQEFDTELDFSNRVGSVIIMSYNDKFNVYVLFSFLIVHFFIAMMEISTVA